MQARLDNPEWLEAQAAQMSPYEIAAKHRLTLRAVNQAMRQYGIRMAPTDDAVSMQMTIDREHRRLPSLDLFAARFKAVYEARKVRDHVALRQALVDLMAVCAAWHDRLVA
jgi:hypothetical protein